MSSARNIMTDNETKQWTFPVIHHDMSRCLHNALQYLTKYVPLNTRANSVMAQGGL